MNVTYENVKWNELKDVIDELGGMKKLISGEIVITDPSQFVFSTTWKTVELGTGPRTADGFRKVFKEDGYGMFNWAGRILDKMNFSVVLEKKEVELVVVSISQLGFGRGAYLRDIYERAMKLGLELCPAEVGPQLRLQYPDQPRGEWLFIGMNPITAPSGYCFVFGVGHHNGRWLYGLRGGPATFWLGNDRWVFLRRK